MNGLLEAKMEDIDKLIVQMEDSKPSNCWWHKWTVWLRNRYGPR